MINSFTGVGRLTRDPELRRTQTGKAVTNFTLAINRERGENQANYIPVICWEKLAENVQKYVHKGSLVAVYGNLQSRQYETNDGKKRTVVEVLARTVQFLETRNQEAFESPSQTYNEPQQYANTNTYNTNEFDNSFDNDFGIMDDMPF